jgi:hypothetical protein
MRAERSDMALKPELPSSARRRRNTAALAAAAGAVALLVVGCTSLSGDDDGSAPASARGSGSASEKLSKLEREWGVKLLGIRPTAAGYALDLRYEVLDPEKATPILQRKYSRNPHVVVEKSGAVLRVPFSAKVGSLRQSVRTANQIKPGKRYFMVFANPGKHVQSGDQVTIVIGKFRAEHVVVQ